MTIIWNSSNSTADWNSTMALYSTSTQSVYARITAFILQIYNYLIAYYMPWIILSATINNVICLLVFTLNRDFMAKSNPNVRLYYIGLAAADLCTKWANFTNITKYLSLSKYFQVQ